MTNFSRKHVVPVLCLFASVMVFAVAVLMPSAAYAACSAGADSSGSKVRFISCTEAEAAGGDSSVNIPYMSGINAGDTLIAVVSVKGPAGHYVPSGWVRVMAETRNSVTVAAFRRIADGSESGNLAILRTGNRYSQGLMMRFTGSTGRFEVAFDRTSAGSSAPKAPALTPSFSNYTAIRIAGFAGEAFGSSLGGDVITAGGTHKNIGKFTAPTPGTSPTNAVSLSAATRVYTSGGTATEATFGVSGSNEALSATIALEYGPSGTPTAASPGASCPRDADALLSSSQVIQFIGCTGGGKPANASTGLSVLRPGPSNVAGDTLIALVSVESSAIPTAPSGWTRMYYNVHKTSGNGGSFTAFKRTTSASEPSSYSFGLSNNRPIALSVSRYRNVSNVTYSYREETGESMLVPAISAPSPQSLVIHVVGADDRDLTGLPSEIIPYYRNLATEYSQRVDGGTHVEAAYTNLEEAGPVPIVRMYNLQDEESTISSIVLSPVLNYQLRFSMPDTTSQVCGTQPVTLRVTDTSGNVYTDFTGTVNLSADATSALRAGARWLDLDDSLNGSLSSGTNGTATYTFNSADNGVAVFDFHNPNATTHDFNASYTTGGTTYREPSSYDPSLTINNACQFRISHDGNLNTCSPEGITFQVVDAAGVNAYAYTGTMNVSANTARGNFSIASGNGSLSPSSDTDNNGNVNYTFAASDNARVTLNYSTFVGGTVNFNAADSSRGFTTASGYDPNLAAHVCDIRIVVNEEGKTGDTCSSSTVTFQVTGNGGELISNYSGVVWVSAASGLGDWSGGGSNSVANGGAGDGVAAYLFDTGDNGSVSLELSHPVATASGSPLGFSATSTAPNGAELSTSLSVNQTLTIRACTITLEVADGIGATCAPTEVVTYTIRNGGGEIATDFTGAISLASDSASGDYLAIGANGTFDNDTANDGSATYTYSSADNGVLTVNYGNPDTGSVELSASGTGLNLASGSEGTIVLVDCEVQVRVSETDDTGYMCSIADIEFTVVDSLGVTVSSFEGSLTLATDTGNGDWSGGGENSVANATANDGIASYAFDAEDEGVVALGFSHLYETATGSPLGFTVAGTATNGASLTQSSAVDEEITILGCTVDIQVDDAVAGTCSSGETVTYTIRDGEGNAATNFQGYLVLDADTGKGDYAPISANGEFNNAEANDGAALYEFALADAGVLTLVYSNTNVGEVMLTASAPSIYQDDDSNAEIDLTACEFRIAYPDSTPRLGDVCTAEKISFGLYESTGELASGYVGTINVSASTGLGAWAVEDADGTVVDLAANDGNFSYTFAATDNGLATFEYIAGSVGNVNFDVTDSVSNDPRDSSNAYDRDLVVSACNFQISFDGGGSSTHADGSVSSCAVQAVTIEAYSSTGVLRTDYVGLINISTTSNRGNWSIADAEGTLTAVGGADSGAATYQFDANDNGSITLQYSDGVVGTMRVAVDDEINYVDPAADPELTITGCVPTVSTPSCSYPDASASLAITAQATDPSSRGRLVVMLIAYSGVRDVGGVEFGGVAMTRIHRAQKSTGVPAIIDMWGILDADLPTSAGTYTGSYTGGNNGPAMCLMFLDNVEQAFPTFNSLTPSAGAVNGTIGEINTATTAITTPANNSVVVSGVIGGQLGGAAMDYGDPQPPELLRVFQGPDPIASDFAGSAGVIPSQGAVDIVEVRNGTQANRHAHVAAAFGPLIAGPPTISGYVPLSLRASYTGNLSFKAIGSSLRNSDYIDGSCDLKSATAPATLDLPGLGTLTEPNSSIKAAWLYWYGSGDVDAPPSGVEFDTVSFTTPGALTTSLDADALFFADQAFGSLDYYLAIKDVSSLVSLEGAFNVSNIGVDTGLPWGSNCLGGWSLVVVYENSREQFRTVNLYDGNHPIIFESLLGGASAELLMTNFRMASPDTAGNLPNGQIAFIAAEGDDASGAAEEAFSLQAAPGSANFNVLTNNYNLPYAVGNGTISRPIYTLQDLDPGLGTQLFYAFDDSLGSGGYSTDFAAGGASGLDIDTFNLSPAGEEYSYLFPTTTNATTKGLTAFGNVNAESMRSLVTTRGDGMLVFAKVFSVTSAAVADIEITVSERDGFRVGATGIYDIVINNNGDGTSSFGSASGVITVAGQLPAGLSFADTAAVSGSGWDCTVSITPAAYTCEFAIATDWVTGLGAQLNGELGESSVNGVGESLPTLSASVEIADSDTFSSPTNRVVMTARVLHSDGSCSDAATGLIPDPSDCAPPEYDNVNFLDAGAIDINDLSTKTTKNNNVDSITTSITLPVADISIVKELSSPLNKTTGAGTYEFRITNLGPDEALGTVRMLDTLPSGVSVVAVGGEFFCNPSTTTTIDCLRSFDDPPMAVGRTFVITVLVSVTGDVGDSITNTAHVFGGAEYLDDDLSNNYSTVVTTIIETFAVKQEKLLFSVDTLETGVRGATKLAALSGFRDDDLVIYDPLTDSASLFFNDTTGTDAISMDNIDAVHLLPNGHLVLSVSGTGSATGVGSFGAGDIIRYDPIKQVSTLLFDGESHFNETGVDIDAVYVLDNGDLVFSTVDAASLGSLSWVKSDLIRFDPATSSASMYLDGSRLDVFSLVNESQLSGAYFRADETDATKITDVINLTTLDDFARIGVAGRPYLGTVMTKDDVGEIDLKSGSETEYFSDNIFLGNSNPGIFSSVGSPNRDAARGIDALHIVEEAYMGHFAIAQSQAGSVCEVGKITITKHQGTSHTSVDTDYYGSVLISTSTGTGDWGLTDGSGTLDNGTAGDGMATYTFVPSDEGVVELSLAITSVTSGLNVNVTNGIVTEAASEDPNFNFSTVVSTMQYLDEFTEASFSNSDGDARWAGSWLEIDDANGVSGANSGAGVAVGNVRVGSGVLTLASSVAALTGRAPSVARSINLGSYTVTEAINLDYDYAYSGANAADSIIVEASDDGIAWLPITVHTGLSGSGTGLSASTTRLDTLGGILDDFSGTLSIRFRVASGYTSGGSFSIDNVEVTTGTTDCGVAAMDHYAISHEGSAIMCLGSTITIVGHDSSHNPTAVPLGEVMTLSNNRLKGTWASIVSGGGTLIDVGAAGVATNTDGQGTYAWSGSEDTVQLHFNYTGPATDPEAVNFNLSGSYFEDSLTAGHDEDLSFAQAGLRFFNVGAGSAGIPTQLSGKASNVGFGATAIQLQAINSAEDDASVCAALFPDEEVVEIEFAAECANPANCSSTAPAQSFTVNGASLGVALQNTNGVPGAANYQALNTTFATASVGTAAPIIVNYSDAGQMQLHARYNIPFDSDPDGVVSGDYLEGSTT
ncbi:MAG: hypothetical protein P1V29_11235, partial [Gammaproteobacteria bacterium]|nr:hypothetical protein [Gammaproteobacteria bacterium]